MSRYLARAVAAFVAVVLVVLIVPIALLSTRLTRTELRERADRQAALVATTITSVGLRRSGESVARITAEPGVRTIVSDADGDVVADSAPSLPLPPLPDVATVARGDAPSRDAAGGVLAAAPIVGSNGDLVGVATVTVAASRIADRTRLVGATLVGIGVTVVAAAGVFGTFLARSLVRPVEQLDAQAGALASGRLDTRVTVPPGPTELRRLAESFNDMSARLDALISAQRAFVSDAAHELRGPLTVLRLRLEALEDRTPDDADVRAAADEVGRLRLIVEQLLALARLEREELPSIVTLLGATVREHCELWSALADEHGVVLRTRLSDEGPLVRVLPGSVEQILDNFLENAIRVAPAGSDVVVTTGRYDGRAALRVADRGAGMSEDERARAFDRFWRGPGAVADGGSGLGLAIVARLAAASGGEARLAARPGGGTEAIALFPLADRPTR